MAVEKKNHNQIFMKRNVPDMLEDQSSFMGPLFNMNHIIPSDNISVETFVPWQSTLQFAIYLIYFL